jgi:sporulation protein YlmC with PRC-barrel domain
MRLSDLIALPVHTVSGKALGHVHDVRAELTATEVHVTGLVVGRLGLLERLGIGAPNAVERIRGGDVVSWSSVARADRRGVVVRDGALETHGARPPSSSGSP